MSLLLSSKDHVGAEQGGESAVAVRRVDAENGLTNGAHGFGLQIPEGCRDAQPTGNAAIAAEDFLKIWEREHEAHGFTLDLREDEKIGIGEGPEVIGGSKQIFERQRVESAVAIQSDVVKAVGKAEFFVQAIEVE